MDVSYQIEALWVNSRAGWVPAQKNTNLIATVGIKSISLTDVIGL